MHGAAKEQKAYSRAVQMKKSCLHLCTKLRKSVVPETGGTLGLLTPEGIGLFLLPPLKYRLELLFLCRWDIIDLPWGPLDEDGEEEMEVLVRLSSLV